MSQWKSVTVRWVDEDGRDQEKTYQVSDYCRETSGVLKDGTQRVTLDFITRDTVAVTPQILRHCQDPLEPKLQINSVLVRKEYRLSRTTLVKHNRMTWPELMPLLAKEIKDQQDDKA